MYHAVLCRKSNIGVDLIVINKHVIFSSRNYFFFLESSAGTIGRTKMYQALACIDALRAKKGTKRVLEELKRLKTSRSHELVTAVCDGDGQNFTSARAPYNTAS